MPAGSLVLILARGFFVLAGNMEGTKMTKRELYKLLKSGELASMVSDGSHYSMADRGYIAKFKETVAALQNANPYHENRHHP